MLIYNFHLYTSLSEIRFFMEISYFPQNHIQTQKIRNKIKLRTNHSYCSKPIYLILYSVLLHYGIFIELNVTCYMYQFCNPCTANTMNCYTNNRNIRSLFFSLIEYILHGKSENINHIYFVFNGFQTINRILTTD